jgi:hypothetical protein
VRQESSLQFLELERTHEPSPPRQWHLSVMRTPVALSPFSNGKVRQ